MDGASLSALDSVKVKLENQKKEVKLVRSHKDIKKDCKILGKIGKGAYGIVHKVEYRKMVCVMKTGKGKGETESDIMDRVVKEALTLHEINGAGGAPRVWALAQDAPVIIMSLCKGKELDSITFNKDSSIPKLAELLHTVGISLSSLHAVGCMHNDLKPDNIMMDKTKDGKLKISIIDFGAATLGDRRPQELSTAAAEKGEPSPKDLADYKKYDWYAPELYFKREALPASDVFSFGKLMDKMLTNMEAAAGHKLKLSPDLKKLITSMTLPEHIERPSLHEVTTKLEQLSM